LSQPAPSAPSPLDRLRARFGSRAGGIAFALLIEALVVALLLFGLAPKLMPPQDKTPELTVFTTKPPPPPPPPPPRPPTSEARTAKTSMKPRPVTLQAPPSPTTSVPDPGKMLTPEPPAMLNIPLNRIDIASLPRGAAPAAPRGRLAGPPNLASLPGDTPRMEGRGPGGETLYNARWVREPYPSELSGYLSTAKAPGMALIACRTVADFRVEDCVKLDEYPEGSNLARALIAASWQFRVRPPRLGGQYKVGEWVGIRYNVGIKREPPR